MKRPLGDRPLQPATEFGVVFVFAVLFCTAMIAWVGIALRVARLWGLA